MNFYIKQRIFSFRNKFDIYDASGNVLYYCEGSLFKFPRQLIIYDLHGNPLVHINQKSIFFLQSFEIVIGGVVQTTIKQKFHLFKHSFTFEDHKWSIDGNFFAYNYKILCDNEIIGNIQKAFFTWGDTYSIEANPRYNPLLVLASAIVVDTICHNGNRH